MFSSSTAPTGLARFVPLLDWLPRYDRSWLRPDLIAGLTAAAVVIPQAMAYASIAGLPVEAGLYVALVPMLLYAIFGSSRPLSVSTTSTLAMLTATALAGAIQSSNPSDYLIPAATLSFLVGVFLLLAGLLRLGFVANFISLPVLTGFKAGIGIVIFVGQLGKVLGIPVEKGPLLQNIVDLVQGLDQIHWLTFGLALLTLGILLFLPHLVRRIPAPLVAVLVTILLSALFHLGDRGVALVGPVPAGLPTLALPDRSLLAALWPAALGIALMSFTESIASARAFKRPEDPPLDANQELVALGIANLGGSFTQAMPASGGTSQTAVNAQAGARTQLAAVVTALTVLAILLFLAPVISLMPEAALGALVLLAATGLIKVSEFKAIARVRRTELWWAIAALLGVSLFGALEGILVAVIISVFSLIYKANHPPVYELARKPGAYIFRPRSPEHPEDETLPGLLMIRSEGFMDFASAPRTEDRVWELIRQSQPRVIIADFSAIPDVEYTALKMLMDLEEKLNQKGVSLWISALNPEPLQVFKRSGLADRLGPDRMFLNLTQAVKAYERTLAEEQS